MIHPSPHRASLLLTCSLVLLLNWAGTDPALAHHGRDFLLTQTAELPHAGQLFVISRQDLSDGDEREVELEPTILFGATDRLTLELHSHVEIPDGGSTVYESTAPAIHFRLTPRESRWGLALSAEWEFNHLGEGGEDEEGEGLHAPRRHSARSLGTAFLPSGGGEEGGADDVAEVTLSLSRALSRSLVAFNVVATEVQSPGADVEWSYRFGWRHGVLPGLSLGVEADGNLEEDEGEALLGIYWEPSDRFTFNSGIGTGYGDEELDLSVRTALVVRVR